MKCPYCNKEMESGYVQCRDGLHWTPKKHKGLLYPEWEKVQLQLEMITDIWLIHLQ